MRLRLPALAAFVLGACLLSACVYPNIPPASHHPSAGQGALPDNVGAVVYIIHGIYAPSLVKIRAGQSVVWKFKYETDPTQIVFKDFHSPVFHSGHYFHQFNTPGTYSYVSALSAISSGKVVVSP